MSDLIKRAFAAWFKSQSDIIVQPSDGDEIKLKGKKYIVLRNVRGILAVYRVRNDGMLKRLKRWPKEIGE